MKPTAYPKPDASGPLTGHQSPVKKTTKPPTTISLIFRSYKEVFRSSPLNATLYIASQNFLSVLDVFQIFLLGKLLDSIGPLLSMNTPLTLEVFATTPAAINLLTIMFVGVLSSIFNKVGVYTETQVYDSSDQFFRENVMTKLSQMNLQDVETKSMQNLLTSVPTYSFTAQFDNFKRLTSQGYNLIVFIASFSIVATRLGWWSVIVVAALLPEILIRYRTELKIKRYRDKNTEKIKYLTYLYDQSSLVRNFTELRVDNVFGFFINAFKSTATDYYKKLASLRLRGNLMYASVPAWLTGIFTRIAQIMLIPLSISRHYSIGTFKFLFDYIDKLHTSAWNLLWESFQLSSTALYARDYFSLMDYQGFGDIVSGSETLDPLTTPRIEFVNVSFSYPSSPSSALHEINLEIEPGTKIAITGKDNSGKSTIAKLICGLYEIGPGDILIENISVRNLSRGELKNKIAIMFENFVKYNFSIRKNITVTEPDRDFNRRLYEEVLEITGLSEWMKEEGIDDSCVLGKMFGTGREISTGNWQRIGIARALYRDRPILILDESLTQIDSFSRGPILEAVLKHRPKQTVIYITQEHSDTKPFDTVVHIEKGRIQEIVKKGKKVKATTG
ncbi:MAG: ABC transporter ATP-binding protein [Candidatus Dojkabacteria bacterium]|nr:ABC transporter ATP-binding protein [Candidatus Dojkabacteria bacterium]